MCNAWTRQSAIPANIFEPDRFSGKYCLSQAGVKKHHTGPKYSSVHDLFMQISNILQQPAAAGIAMPKFINCQMHRAFEPFLTVDITILGTSAEGAVDGESL